MSVRILPPFIAHIHRSLTTLCENRLPVIRFLHFFFSLFIFIIFYDFIDAKENIPCEKKTPGVMNRASKNYDARPNGEEKQKNLPKRRLLQTIERKSVRNDRI